MTAEESKCEEPLPAQTRLTPRDIISALMICNPAAMGSSSMISRNAQPVTLAMWWT